MFFVSSWFSVLYLMLLNLVAGVFYSNVPCI